MGLPANASTQSRGLRTALTQERLLVALKHSGRFFVDETTEPVLDPGQGRTRIGQLWAYTRDDRPWGGSDPPGVAYVYAPERAAGRLLTHLSGFAGMLQVDAYAAYENVVEGGAVRLAYRSRHVRRQFYDLVAASPITMEALSRIATL